MIRQGKVLGSRSHFPKIPQNTSQQEVFDSFLTQYYLSHILRGTKRDEVERGQVLAKPGSITPHTKFESEVYVLSKDEAAW